jgi:regulation of enolase protein 1 (concanavalin A-like superfamily)
MLSNSSQSVVVTKGYSQKWSTVNEHQNKEIKSPGRITSCSNMLKNWSHFAA